jgi:ribosomal protein L7Ae-like RNA K-turn-binding protein
MIRTIKLDDHSIALIGFAIKAGSIVKGFQALVRAIQANSIAVIILNSQISDNSLRKIKNKTRHKKIPMFKTESNVNWDILWGIRTHNILGILTGELGRNISEKFKAGV